MPWSTNTIIQAKQEFIALAQSPHGNFRALCKRFNVSRQTGYKVVNRFRELGEEGLQERSRRPLHSPFKTSKLVEDAVVSIRTIHPSWGARRIATELKAQQNFRGPALSTIHAILSRHGLLYLGDKIGALEWISAALHDRAAFAKKAEAQTIVDSPDLGIVLEHLLSPRLLERRRAIVILADSRGVRPSVTCKLLRLSHSTYRRCVRVFAEGGAAALFAPRISRLRKFDDKTIMPELFDTLHQPPSNYGINRTTWKMADLSGIMKERGHPVSEDVIRKMIRSAGYRWRKARVVLTSNDPAFSEKLDRIQSILANLPADEAFFSIDEYGPFAVKAQPGRSLAAPGEQRIVPQWQKSRGSVTVTAALELSSSQITHFYSSRKNTDEMIRMMNVLIGKYKERKRIYLSWDAASWHISKRLAERIEDHNSSGTWPVVATAPLPARAQFLNVIESVFSGMARAVIQNSNYASVEEAKAAIDRYFEDRNKYFKEHPRKAGNKIWGNERMAAKFSPSNNCKDPRLG
jgi:transposase